jgi:mono/diheme cytochrome c family protein
MDVGDMRTTRAPDCAVLCRYPHRGLSNRLRRRPVRAVFAVLDALLAGILTATISTAVGLAQDAPSEPGRIAYLRDCAGCHGESGVGDGPDAPFLASAPADLRRGGVLQAYQNDALQARIREGKTLALEIRPGALRDHARQTEVLYGFLVRLPGIAWGKVEIGQDLYLTRCLPCHDRYGHPEAHPMKGVRKEPRDLANPAFQRAVTDDQLDVLARHGKAAMPALIPRLTEEEVTPLVSFIRLLSPGYEIYSRYCERCHGMEGRGADGPFAELGTPHFAFDANYFATHDREQVLGAMWHMLQKAKPQMPHFESSLSQTDLAAILSYLRSLPPMKPTEAH